LDKEQYKKLVEAKSKNPYVLEDAFISFLTGGVLGALYQIITVWYMRVFDITAKMALSYACLTFIVLAVILTGFGVFDNLVSKFKFGLIIPITGFAHSVASSLLDYKRDGLISGLGSNMFKLAGSVMLYGSVAAFIGAIIKVIIYG
jgi:stage V sporulation protein AC